MIRFSKDFTRGFGKSQPRQIIQNILVPVPRVDSLIELNETLLERCQKYEAHRIQGRPDTVGAMYRLEKESLHPLPRYTFETAKCTSVRVNAFSTVCFRTNRYSVPVEYVGWIVGIKAYPETIEVYCNGVIHHRRTRALLRAISEPVSSG